VQGYRDRIYSSDWARPEDVHGSAVERVERWLAAECADPDTAYPLSGAFRALLARWG
jgi:hypothetical protein